MESALIKLEGMGYVCVKRKIHQHVIIGKLDPVYNNCSYILLLNALQSMCVPTMYDGSYYIGLFCDT